MIPEEGRRLRPVQGTELGRRTRGERRSETQPGAGARLGSGGTTSERACVNSQGTDQLPQ
jgi:hypothetical protein